MKKAVFSIFCAFAALTVLSAQTTTQVKDFKLSGFKGISVGQAITVVATQSDKYSVSAEVKTEYEPYLVATVEDGVLVVKLNDLPKKLRSFKGSVVKLNISMPTLTKLILSGAASFESETYFNSPSDEVKIDLSGAAKVKTMYLSASKVDFKISGSSVAMVMVDAGDVDSEISGASKLTLKGSSNQIEAEVSGASGLHAKELAVSDAFIEASGASKILVSPTNRLNIELSGASSCTYTENDQLIINARKVTGAASLKSAK